MIKFFRRIRQKLLAENRFSKYLIYAIGEIILVVIGILIALQVNNWNEKRKSSEHEKQLLIQLQADFKTNAHDLKTNITYQEQILRSATLLTEHFKNGLPYHDSLNVHFSNMALWTKFIVNEGAYRTIESKGLDLISNTELRDLTFRIYEQNLNWIQQMEEVSINLVETFKSNKASFFFSEWNPVNIENGNFAKGNAVIIDYGRFDADTSFQYFINSTKNNNEVLLAISKGYLDDNEQGIKLIDNLLNKDHD